MAQMVIEVAAAIDLGPLQPAGDLRVGRQEIPEVPLPGQRRHRRRLHPGVGVLSRHPLAGKRQQHRARSR